MRAQVIQSGHFIFADGDHATQKIEMDHLWEYPDELAVVVRALAAAEGLPVADVILGVPEGGQSLADAIGRSNGLPVVKLERIPGGTKQDFRFCGDRDRKLALAAKSPRIYEDVVTTLSSIAGVVRLLNPELQSIHSLAIWRRGATKLQYRRGLSDYYLIEEDLPSYAPGKCPVCSD